jgi:hypothetical protein
MAARPPVPPGGEPPIEFEGQRKVAIDEEERRRRAAGNAAENDRLDFEARANAAANARNEGARPRIRQEGDAAEEEKKKADEALKKQNEKNQQKPKDSHHSDHHGGLSWERIGRHLADTVGGQDIKPVEERFVQRWFRKGIEKVAETFGGAKAGDQAEQFRNAEQGLHDAARNGGPPGAEGEPILPARDAEVARNAQAEPEAPVERPRPDAERPQAEEAPAPEPRRQPPRGDHHAGRNEGRRRR